MRDYVMGRTWGAADGQSGFGGEPSSWFCISLHLKLSRKGDWSDVELVRGVSESNQRYSYKDYNFG